MGKIIELIKSFINPIQPEKSLDELALEAGISGADLDLLKKSANGLENSWEFADDVEEPEKKKGSKSTTAKETQIQPEQKNVVEEKNTGFERD